MSLSRQFNWQLFEAPSRKRVDEEIFIDCFNAGLTMVEIATIFNVNEGTLGFYVRKHNLQREKPKSDFTHRYGKRLKSGAHVSKLKGTSLRKCLNPKCDNYYYGHVNERYCCPKCGEIAHNIKYRDYRNKWYRNKYRSDTDFREKALTNNRRQYQRRKMKASIG